MVMLTHVEGPSVAPAFLLLCEGRKAVSSQ